MQSQTPAHALTICYLYPRQMNSYGDTGNLLVLTQRMRWRGIRSQVVRYHPGDCFPPDVDLIFGGGTQDSGQRAVASDLPRIATSLKDLIEAGTPALAVCGTYQLFGSHIVSLDGQTISGVGIFDMHTTSSQDRLVGNIIIEDAELGTIIGYENHGGRTVLGLSAQPFGLIVSGAGNNGEDKTEGIRYKHAIGTYLHGPLLPKNPSVADYLIQHAFEKKYQQPLPPLEQLQSQSIDELTTHARGHAQARPR